jgi:hypothetical protein
MYRLLKPRQLNPIGWLDGFGVLGVKGDRFFFKLTFDDSRYNVTNPLFWVWPPLQLTFPDRSEVNKVALCCGKTYRNQDVIPQQRYNYKLDCFVLGSGSTYSLSVSA